MYEPVHGSAPDIAGKGIANPLAMILAGAMMLDDLGEEHSAQILRDAVDDILRDGIKTRDLGGTASTSDVTSALMKKLS